MTILLANRLSARGFSVCVLTRGYKRKNPSQMILVSRNGQILADVENAGDEPMEIAEQTQASVIADANRIRAAKWALENLHPSLFLLDDGFQHLKVQRDVDVVLVNATNPFGNDYLLPAGILREPISELKRADIIVITKSNLIDSTELASLKSRIVSINSKAKIFTAEIFVSHASDLNGTSVNLEDIRQRKALAFCAIANPESFFMQLRKEGFQIVSTKEFLDHHYYKSEDVAEILNLAKQSGAEILLTTPKDAVKIKRCSFALPCFILKSEFRLDEEFIEVLLSSLDKN